MLRREKRNNNKCWSTSSNSFIGMSGEKEFYEETQAYSSVRADSKEKSDDANRPRKEINRRALLTFY